MKLKINWQVHAAWFAGLIVIVFMGLFTGMLSWVSHISIDWIARILTIGKVCFFWTVVFFGFVILWNLTVPERDEAD